MCTKCNLEKISLPLRVQNSGVQLYCCNELSFMFNGYFPPIFVVLEVQVRKQKRVTKTKTTSLYLTI